MRAGHLVSAFAGLALSLAFVACAQIGAPQGGPADAEPPLVNLTAPASGDVFVARDAVLSLQFSEPIDRKTLEGNLQMAPPRAGTPKYKWSEGGRRVTITWSDSLRDSTTYRVTVNNRVADRRGNKFKEPYTFAFSTGAQLDRGEIRGYVRADDPAATFDIYAYRLGAMPDTFWLAPPDYFTTSGAEGRFALPFLRAGEYRILVLNDANRNKRLDHGEQFALAARDFVVGDEVPPDSNEYFPAALDTVPFTLRACAVGGAGAMTLDFSHPLDTSRMGEWVIAARDSMTGQSLETDILRPTRRRANIIVLLGNWVVGSAYVIHVGQISDQHGRTIDSGMSTCTYEPPRDVSAPRIDLVVMPTTTDAFTISDPIVWQFSEPVDTSRFAGAASVRDSAGGPIEGAWNWLDRQTLSFAPIPSWPDTTTVLVHIDSSRVVDLAGNVAAAGTYNWRFEPLSDDDMGAMEGRLESPGAGPGNFLLELRGVGSSRRHELSTPAPGTFSIVVPAGRWQLGGFVDADGDGRWFPGQLTPFANAETRVLASDTLIVRARFTLEDVTLQY